MRSSMFCRVISASSFVLCYIINTDSTDVFQHGLLNITRIYSNLENLLEDFDLVIFSLSVFLNFFVSNHLELHVADLI